MLNQVILVGQVVKQYKENNDTFIVLKIATTTPTNRESSSNVCDLIHCRLGQDFKDLDKYLIEGATLGVKAKISISTDGSIVIDAQKITFVSSRYDEDE